MFNWTAQWIKPTLPLGEAVPVFGKVFSLDRPVKEAHLYITAMGVYEARLNDQRVGEFVMAPGWTVYYKRLQYQCYDVTTLLQNDNQLTVSVGKGWYRSRLPWKLTPYQAELRQNPCGLLAQLEITYEDGSRSTLTTDESWKVSDGPVRFAELYDGQIYDATFTPALDGPVEAFDGPSHTLIPQEGEDIREQERIAPVTIFTAPNGERVIDFGQNLAGYVEINLTAHAGDAVCLSFGELLDGEGNFYNENYRSAKSWYSYTCREGKQTYKPQFTFYGFRYARIDAFPGGVDKAVEANFRAIVIHSQMKRTGRLNSSHPLLNQLFANALWSQKGNFIDVPTDCPQRDERLGWTGDAQVFVKTASLNYDVERFFTKWLGDLAADQHEDGYVGHVVPDVLQRPQASTAWGDAATICPWTIYLAYGNPQILRNQFASMCKWVDYITGLTTTPGLWTGGEHHYGDWLSLDKAINPKDDRFGGTSKDFIASAFYAYSTSLVIKAGKALGKDVSAYEALYEQIVKTFQQTYHVYHTQTECILAAHFKLAEDPQKAADQLAQMVKDAGVQLRTGFVGTPYMLHVLSDYGYTDLAYSLLLREDYPSWLYPVRSGATTIWERWDGVRPDGTFQNVEMNSYNHYAYGSVCDWVYTVAAGIQTLEDAPGYARALIAPQPDPRLDWLEASLETRHGLIRSLWKKIENRWRYEITTPVEADVIIAGQTYHVPAGDYCFYSAIE